MFLTAFAEGEAAAAAEMTGAQGVMGMVSMLFPLVLIFVFMWLIMIRPQRKKEKALREKINAMKVGDKVTTIGGIRGKVSRIKDDFVIIETGNVGTPDERSFIKFEKSAIKEVQTKISN